MTDHTTAFEQLGEFERLARQRRTSLLVEADRPVDPGLVDRLITLVTWAPNHKRTWPWRFAVFTGPARLALGEAFARDQAALGTTDEAKLAKTRRKYQRAPVTLVVGCDDGDSPERTDENRDAVAAGIQNLLLGATAVGLASFWSSPPARRGPASLAVCGFPATTQLVGVIYLGWPSAPTEVPPRPAPVVTRHG